jgi:sigma-54 dependent transcriptional regulator, acetoin dehydrogenase operon transcriptional activator AcoR
LRFLAPPQQPDLVQVHSAWEQFVGAGAPPSPHLRGYVARAWERSRAAGCDPFQPKAHLLSARDTEALLAAQARLVTVVGPFLHALSAAAGDDRHAAMLADGNGRLLQVVADRETAADENFPAPGALLAERTSGANGVGTALAENGYVELVGPEHYIEGFQVFTCQGAPLEGPAGGCAGVLSMSVRRLETADKVRDILFCASEAAACELLSSWLKDAVSTQVEPVLEKLRQDMVQRIAVTRLRLELAARQIAGGTDATTTIDAAIHLSRKFGRQAALWRSLALSHAGAIESIRLEDLVADLLELLQTEARVASVQFAWGEVQTVRVVADRPTLLRQLLNAALTSIQASAVGAAIEVSVRKRNHVGSVTMIERGTDSDLAPVLRQVDFPALD